MNSDFKKEVQIMKILIFTFLSLFVLSCATAGVILLDPSKSYPPTTHVELLLVEPIRPYDVIAIIEANGGLNVTVTQIMEKARKKAQEIGANALFIADNQQRYQSPQQVRNFDGSPLTIPGGYITQVKILAIRYTD
ncbi:hypothetical protein HOE22_04915 [Candidatus Woesearchaeota archaeon]|jgi:hypothetical protein|nr:hypothetical protein [Candidatus Woesearchaeota archaeon]MBT5531231.1 hypothetical protein [Cytophagia bacterium]